MNRLKSPLRRLLAVTAGALLGVTGAVALTGAGVAQATPHGGKKCVSAADARYEHEFDGPAGTASIKLLNGPLCAGQEQAFALVSYIAPSAKLAFPQQVFDSSVQKFEGPKGERLSMGGYHKPTLTFKVDIPDCFTQVDFVFGAEIIDPLDGSNLYGDRKVGSRKGEGSRSRGPQAWWNGGKSSCAAVPEAEFVSDCTGKVVVKLANRGKSPAKFTVTADGGFTKDETVAAGGIVDVEVPAANAKNIVVKADGKEVAKGGWVKPEDCAEPAEPEGSVESTCDELIFSLQVPKGGETVTVTLTPNKGAPQTLVAEPGAAQPSVVRFKGVKGLVVTPSAEGLDDTTPIAWEPPADCDKDNGTGGGSGDEEEEPTLPVTGAAAGGIVAGALGLLAAGAVFFVVARRRRVTFIA